VAQHQVGLDVGDPVEPEERALHEVVERVEVAAEHAQVVIGLAGGGVAILHLVVAHHLGHEALDDVARVAHQPDMDDGVKVEPRAARVDLGPVAADHAGFLQRAHPPPAGRGRHAHALGQFLVRQPRVALQQVQDAKVTGFQLHAVLLTRIFAILPVSETDSESKPRQSGKFGTAFRERLR
jgi:hypothetical protein